MATLLQPQPSPDDQRVILNNVSWPQYETLLATLGDFLVCGSFTWKEPWRFSGPLLTMKCSKKS